MNEAVCVSALEDPMARNARSAEAACMDGDIPSNDAEVVRSADAVSERISTVKDRSEMFGEAGISFFLQIQFSQATNDIDGFPEERRLRGNASG